MASRAKPRRASPGTPPRRSQRGRVGARDLALAGETARRSAPEVAAELDVAERVLLFCLASGTDWTKAGVTNATAHHLLVRGLVDRDPSPARFALTAQGRAVLDALLRERGAE